MAKSGGSRGAKGRDAASRRGGAARASAGKKSTRTSGKTSPQKPKPKPKPPAPAPDAATLPTGPFVLGAIPGATPGKWIDTWHERMPHTGLELVPLAVADQRARLVDDPADPDLPPLDAALVRLPIDRTGLSVIPLYDEVSVVVASTESHLMAADELSLADLAGEVVMTPHDDVFGIAVPDTVAPRFAAPATTEEAVATVAAGVGVVIVPMSLARLHHRKDADYRRLADGPVSTVALAWPVDRTTELVETFVGIVRGRTANSSRD